MPTPLSLLLYIAYILELLLETDTEVPGEFGAFVGMLVMRPVALRKDVFLRCFMMMLVVISVCQLLC